MGYASIFLGLYTKDWRVVLGCRSECIRLRNPEASMLFESSSMLGRLFASVVSVPEVLRGRKGSRKMLFALWPP